MSIDLKGRARMIFALLGGIIFLVLKAIFPQLPLTENETLLFIGLIGAYILGEGISGRTMTDNLSTMLKSQKFQTLVAGILVVLIKGAYPTLSISDTELTALIISFGAFIIGAGSQNYNLPVG